MENSRTERHLTAPPEYGKQQAFRAAKRTKIRPSETSKRSLPVRLRMAKITAGARSLNGSDLGFACLSDGDDIPEIGGGVDVPLRSQMQSQMQVVNDNSGNGSSANQTSNVNANANANAGRVLTSTELWELLKYISSENIKVTNTQTQAQSMRFQPGGNNNSLIGTSYGDADSDTTFSFEKESIRSERNSLKKKSTLPLPIHSSSPHTTTNNNNNNSIQPTLSQITELNLGPWPLITMNTLRSISLTLGSTLQTTSLKNCINLTTEMLETFVSRLYNLHTLDLSGCTNLCSSVGRSINIFLCLTLTSLDLSSCPLLTHETLGYISGAIGHNSQSCTKLKSVNLSSCSGIDDRGLVYLSKGCRRLMYLSLEQNTRITDIGIIALSNPSGCKQQQSLLRVVNLSGCLGVTSKSVICLAKKCKGLISINLAYITSLSDNAITTLSNNCTNLKSLNLAGCTKISESSLCALATNCTTLNTLNVTGCSLISRTGLKAVIDGLGYVVEAKSYFGFLPVQDNVSLKLRDLQRRIEFESATLIQNMYKDVASRIEERARVVLSRENKKALDIQLCFQRYLKNKHHKLLKLNKVKARVIVTIQRYVRGNAGRRIANYKRRYWTELMRNTSFASFLQSRIRGHQIRKNDRIVYTALIVLHQEWTQRTRVTSCVLIQKIARRMLAVMRVKLWRVVYDLRRSDINVCALTVQCTVRKFTARSKYSKLLASAKLFRKLRDMACLRIQNMYRISTGKIGGNRQAELRKLRIICRSVLVIQSAYRGYIGREIKKSRAFNMNLLNSTATILQRVFRGTRILHWRDVRMNKIAAYVFKRQRLELLDRQRCADIKNIERIDGAQRDSASDDENDNNNNNSSSSGDNQFKFENERSLIGLKCRIYWPMNNIYYLGKITKFNSAKNRWRVNYRDGDHEWLDFTREGERVQVFSHGGWKAFGMYRVDGNRAVIEDGKKNKILQGEMDLEKEVAESWVFVGYEDDDETLRGRYYSNVKDEMRYSNGASNDMNTATPFDSWEIRSDSSPSSHYWEYYDTVSDKSVPWNKTDPRLSQASDSEALKQHKINIISDLRFGGYACRNILNAYIKCQNNDDENGKRRVLEVLRTDKQAKKMVVALRAAAQVWSSREFSNVPELVQCKALQIEISKLTEYSIKTYWSTQVTRKGLLKLRSLKDVKKVVCPNCKYTLDSAASVFCEVCGFKLVGGDAEVKGALLGDGMIKSKSKLNVLGGSSGSGLGSGSVTPRTPRVSSRTTTPTIGSRGGSRGNFGIAPGTPGSPMNGSRTSTPANGSRGGSRGDAPGTPSNGAGASASASNGTDTGSRVATPILKSRGNTPSGGVGGQSKGGGVSFDFE